LREISPAVNLSADDFLETRPPKIQEIVYRIRVKKHAGTRPKPSASLIDHSSILTEAQRISILDKIASLVDENLCGRSEMCIQFAGLLSRALNHLGLPGRPVLGTAIYYDHRGSEIFRWNHAWVRVGEEVIDGNVDCLSENPMVPSSVHIAPYWGPIKKTPADRKLREDHKTILNPDSDVEDIWWPELLPVLDETE
jgi:hypothetical protein